MRAAEVRLEAERVTHPTAKKTLLAMAKSYEQLASQAEEISTIKANQGRSENRE